MRDNVNLLGVETEFSLNRMIQRTIVESEISRISRTRLLINHIWSVHRTETWARNIPQFRLRGLAGREAPVVRKLDVSRKENSIPRPNGNLDLSKIPYARCFNNEAKDLTPRVSPLDSLISKPEFLIGCLIFYLWTAPIPWGEKNVPLLITLVKFPRESRRASTCVKKESRKKFVRNHDIAIDNRATTRSGRNGRTILRTFGVARATRLLLLKFFNEPLEKGDDGENEMVVRVDP